MLEHQARRTGAGTSAPQLYNKHFFFLGGGDLTLVFLSWNVTLVLLKAREYKNTSCCFERLSWFYFQQNVKALLCVHFFLTNFISTVSFVTVKLYYLMCMVNSATAHCSRCCFQIEISRRVTLEELPPVLVLHLKRFVFEKSGGCQKLTKNIDYPVDLEISKGMARSTLHWGVSVIARPLIRFT